MLASQQHPGLAGKASLHCSCSRRQLPLPTPAPRPLRHPNAGGGREPWEDGCADLAYGCQPSLCLVVGGGGTWTGSPRFQTHGQAGLGWPPSTDPPSKTPDWAGEAFLGGWVAPCSRHTGH